MSDHLDDRIRELYSELTEAAPDVPPLPIPQRVRPTWNRKLVFAGAAAVVVLVIGVGGLLQVDFAGDDDAAAPAATVAAPSPPAATAAPETIVTGGGGADVEDQGRPRPIERILLLANLNRSCSESAEMFAERLSSRLDTQEDYQPAFGLIFDRLEQLRTIIEAANPGLSDDELLKAADVVFTAQGSVVLGGDEPLTGGYPVDAIEDLGGFLAEFGATDCAGLAPALP